MLLKVRAFVDTPSAALKAAVPYAHTTPRGRLIIPLHLNRRLSHGMYPNEWTEDPAQDTDLFRFKPAFANGTVHTVHDMPSQLANNSYRLVIEGKEELRRGSRCQIITGHTGEQLRPHRRESTKSYHTSSVFSAQVMGMLQLNVGRRFSLTIHKTEIRIIDGMATTVTQELLRLNKPSLSTDQPMLPAELSGWQAGLTALYSLWQCKATSCNGHYYAD